jgi:hypothetical protein
MTFVVFRLKVESVQSQHLLDLIRGKHASRWSSREVGHPDKTVPQCVLGDKRA